MRKHPNAVIGGLAAGSGGGTLVTWILNDVLNWNVPPTAAAAIAGGIAFVVLFIGRRGIGGALHALWYGSGA